MTATKANFTALCPWLASRRCAVALFISSSYPCNTLALRSRIVEGAVVPYRNKSCEFCARVSLSISYDLSERVTPGSRQTRLPIGNPLLRGISYAYVGGEDEASLGPICDNECNTAIFVDLHAFNISSESNKRCA